MRLPGLWNLMLLPARRAPQHLRLTETGSIASKQQRHPHMKIRGSGIMALVDELQAP